MSPFNIQVAHEGKDITLTIIPEKNYFKIVYFGTIVGAIRNLGTDWELVEENEVEPGDLPWYDYQQSYANSEPRLELHLPEINRIAGAIENEIA